MVHIVLLILLSINSSLIHFQTYIKYFTQSTLLHRGFADIYIYKENLIHDCEVK